jgi:thymidylate synthase
MKRATVNDIRQTFKEKLELEEFVIDKSGVKTIEIEGASFLVDSPTIFGTLNEDYAKRELAWYESQSLNVNDIPEPIPAIWKAVADKNGFINSNYGWCIYSEDNWSQYNSTLETLKKDVDTRRAIMIYTRPSMHLEYNKNGRSDFMCTNTVQYLIRNGELVSIVSMRSNDAIFGFKNDFYWQKHVSEKLVEDLKEVYPSLILGDIIWNVGSLHVYERHFDLVRES